MSTSWDIRCIDCGEDADVSAPFSPIRQWNLQGILEHADALALMSTDFQVEHEGVRVPLAFLKKHKGHRLRLVSEYGDIEDTCGRDLKCGECGAPRGTCTKDIGHDPPCGKRTP